jgi:hypothetical protein
VHNGEKLRKTEHISVDNCPSPLKKIEDNSFLYQMGWIKPKNNFTPPSL